MVLRGVLLFLACVTAPGVRAQDTVDLTPAFPNLVFDRPVDIQHAGDGSGRLFVVEQEGVIRVFDNDAAVAVSAVFLDIRDAVRCCGERGLLGLAFHPSYADNGYFYVDYIVSTGATVVARYRVDPANPNSADPESEEVLLEVAQPFSNHNGGQIAFGPDGYLYIALGDGGGAGDNRDNAQNRTTLLGAILRIDVDSPTGGLAYGIPPDNPFAGNTEGFREEIYAYGLRNPWRFSFDSETGLLWAADVGQGSFEEVDLIVPGGNYGWDCREGAHVFQGSSSPVCAGVTDFVEPVYEYTHALGISITGGYVYRGPGLPALQGQYVFGDFGSGRLWALTYDGTAVTADRELMDTDLTISTFGVDEQGALYVADYGSGTLRRFVPVLADRTDDAAVPRSEARLHGNHPNPVLDTTTITYELVQPGRVELVVYDVQGRRIQTLAAGPQAPGTYTVRWDGRAATGRPLPPGVYVYRLYVDGQSAGSRRLVRMR